MFIGIYVQQISGERLQDHWSSGSRFKLCSKVVEIRTMNSKVKEQKIKEHKNQHLIEEKITFGCLPYCKSNSFKMFCESVAYQ